MNFEIKQAVEILARTPAVLSSLIGNLSDDWVFANEGAETWTPFDVLGHLIHGEETDWMPRARIILEQKENPAFTPFDRFAQFEKSKEKTLPELLNEFSQLRAGNLQMLEEMNLTSKQLKLEGIHPQFGRVTLEQLLATWAVHDLDHLAQISRVMAKQYSQNVGPWKEYLSILKK